MKKHMNSILMLVYILFIFVAVFTRHLYDQSKWNHIVTAITITSWMLVLSDFVESGAELFCESNDRLKPKLEYCLVKTRHNRKLNNRLDVQLIDEFGNETGKTIGQTLDNMEQSAIGSLNTLKTAERSKRVLMVLSDVLLFIGFALFFCALLYEPVFKYFYSKLNGMSVLAFGTILAGQFVGNKLKESIMKIEETLDTLSKSMELLNQSYERERVEDAD